MPSLEDADRGRNPSCQSVLLGRVQLQPLGGEYGLGVAAGGGGGGGGRLAYLHERRNDRVLSCSSLILSRASSIIGPHLRYSVSAENRGYLVVNTSR